MPSIGKQVWVGIMTAFGLAAISIVEMVALVALGLEPTTAIIVMSAINGLLFSVLHQWWSVGLPTSPERTRQGHDGLRLIAGDEATVAELYRRHYAGPDVPDWSDQSHMLRFVHDTRRITILRRDQEGEYWAFYLFRNDLTGLSRDGCHRMFYETFQKVHGDEALSHDCLLVVHG